MIKAIKNIYTEIVWRISRKIFLSIRNDSPSMQLDISEKNLLKHFLINNKKEKKILFDVGANIGSWSKLALKYDKNISIFAFEAINQTYLNLEKNLNKHNADIQIFNKAISNEIGEFEIYNFGENNGTNSFFDNSISYNDKNINPPSTEKVLTTTIDIFCKENNIDSIDFLKCDTEGNDFYVIMGCKEMFKNNRIVALQFEYNWRWINSKSYLKNVFDYFNDTNYLIGKITSNEVQIINEWNPELEKFYESNYLIINKDHIANFKHNFYYFNNKNILQIV
jgi:FkbM family methyltransferase|tara:strand:- start:6156 stop:6995 length:840 start_codon:yes stop_codon:yes gene_type:complete